MVRMARRVTVIALLLAGSAAAAPVDSATQQQLLTTFDNYQKAIASGKFDAITALTSKELGETIKAQTKTDAARRETLAELKMSAPDSVSVVHTFIDAAGTHARLVTAATKTMPKGVKEPGAPPAGTVMRTGLTLAFVKEGGIWKFNEQIFGTDPSTVTGCKNETADPRSSYDSGKTTSAGGPIVRVDFKPDYTLVVFSVVGDANCAFLPAKADLAKLGVDPAQLVPYAIVSLDGIPHRTDQQKMLAEKISVQPEE